MPKYRKKPITVDAVQWFKHGDHPEVRTHPWRGDAGWIPTLEGSMDVYPGSWIVGPGAEGEFWPVKDSIFKATYELVEENPYPYYMSPEF